MQTHDMITDCDHKEGFIFTHTGLAKCKICNKFVGEYKGNGVVKMWEEKKNANP